MINIDESWYEMLKAEFEASYFKKLVSFLDTEYATQTIYPNHNLIFNAFNSTPIKNLKVVILGQDPYHGPNQAHGLCFSVQAGIKPPPSLKNIYKELYADLGIVPTLQGNLQGWANQGVLLLNTTLTVRANQAHSHFGKGWEIYTNAVITNLSQHCNNIVFLLWGNPAHEKEKLINPTKHCILKAAHPSPLSAYKGFLGCKHFSKTNAYLTSKGINPINWSL